MTHNRSLQLRANFRRSSQGREIVVVLGMHRSGTSLLANVLHLLGVDMVDHPTHASRKNPSGFWEREDIVELQDQILAAIGCPVSSPAHCVPFPTGWWRGVELRPLKRKLQDLMASHLSAVRRPWGFKDPRTCRLLPLWGEVLEELDVTPRFVWAVRHPAESAASMSDKMPSLRQIPIAQSEVMWLAYNYDILRYSGRNWPLIVPYDAWFEDALSLAKDLAHELDLVWQGSEHELETALRELINPEWRHKRSADGNSKSFFSVSESFYRSIRSLRTAGGSTAGEDLALTLQSLLGAVQPFALAARDAAQLKEEVKSVSASLDEALSRTNTLQQETQQLTASGKARLAEVAGLKAEIEQLRKEAQLAAAETSRAVDKAAAQEQDAAARLARAEDMTAALKREIESLGASLQQEAARYAEAAGKHEQATAALQAKIGSLSAERQRLQADLKGEAQKSEELRRQLSGETAKRDSYRLELAAVASGQMSLREELDAAQKQLAAAAAERSKLVAQLDGLTQARERSLMELADHTAKYEEAQGRIAEAHFQRESLQAELAQTVSALDTWRAHAEALTAARDTLSQDLAEIAAERDQLRSGLDQSSAFVDELQQKLDESVAVHEEALQQLAELAAERDQRLAEAEELSQDAANLRTELENLGAERDALASKHAEANEWLALADDLQQRLDGRSAEHDEALRQLAEVAAERDAGLNELEARSLELAQVLGELDSLRAEQDLLASEHSDALKDLAPLPADLESAADLHLRLTAAPEGAPTLRERLAAERARLFDLAAAERQWAQELAEEKQRLEDALEASESEKEKLRVEVAALIDRQDSLTAAFAALERERESIEARLAGAEREAQRAAQMRQEEARFKGEIASLRNLLRSEREKHAEDMAMARLAHRKAQPAEEVD